MSPSQVEPPPRTTLRWSLQRTRTYGVIFLAVTAVLYAGTFIFFQQLTMRELRTSLVNTARALDERSEISGDRSLVGDILVLRPHDGNEGRPPAYTERTISGREFLVYEDGRGTVLAASDDRSEREIFVFGVILGVIFIAQAVFTYGWWRFFRAQLQNLQD